MNTEEAVEYPLQHVVACEGCGSTVSVNWFCKNCPGSMCDNCKASHKTSGFTKKHLVVPRTGKVVRTYGPAKIAEECRVHTGKDIVTYCNKCKVACCVSCQVEQHQLHELSLIEDKYLEAENRLNDYTKELDHDLKPKLKTIIQHARQEMMQFETGASDAEAGVNAFRKELKQAVDDSCDAVIKDLRRPKDDINSFIRDVESRLQNVDDLVGQVTNRVREGKLSLIEYVPPSPDTLVTTLEFPSQSRLRFFPNTDVLLYIKTAVGTVQQEMTKGSEIESGKSKKSSPTFEKSMISVEKVSSFRSQIGVKSICLVGDDKAWLAHDCGDTMYLYNSKGQMVESKTIKEKCYINDFTIRQSGELIVSNSDKKVRLVGKSGAVSVLIDTEPSIPRGVCLTDKEEIVVCMQGEDRVVVYSSDGRTMLREKRAQNSSGKQLFTNPYRVVQNCGDICVVNVDKNVVCVDESGCVRWVYDGQQAKLPFLYNPYGICKDKFHNLIVVDWGNDCVHYIDRECRVIDVILKKEHVGLIDPVAICVNDRTGQVWLGNTQRKEVLIAKYLTT